ncbi:hypothetical protein SAY86_024901 [Trapa natans]|uniref:Transcription repressor n=1 Tax=Trapa natans TaxID=22666 RepID=A0AAN7MQY1_TRANT|nr:hypothetical protein SAY86_024901 [Trapa natans]
MTHSNKRKLSLSSGTVDVGCSCRKSIKLFRFLSPKPKVASASSAASSSVYRPSDDSNYSLRCLLNAESAVKAPPKPVKGFGRIDDEGIAVEKDSEDPYLDFRHSMLQMILENGIYSKDDMRELLNCFLQLNSPYYHGVIVRAFTDIWNGVFSVRSPSHAAAAARHYYPSSASPAANNNRNSFNSPYGGHRHNSSSASPAAANNNSTSFNSPYTRHYYNPSSASPAAANNINNNSSYNFNDPYAHYYNPSWHY